MLRTSRFFWVLILFIFSCTKESPFLVNNIDSFKIKEVKSIGGSKNDALFSIKQTTDGGFISVGYTQSNDFDITTKSNDSYDYWVLKFDSNQQLLWSKTFGGSDDDRARDVIELTDGSFLVTGFSRSTDGSISNNNGNYDFWVLKLDNNGNLIWEKNFGFSGSDQSFVIKKTNDGAFLLGGSLDVTASGGQGNSKTTQKHAGGDYWLIKIDENGTKLWSRYFGGQFSDTLLAIAETDSGNLILTGSSDSSDTDVTNNLGEYDYWLVSTNSLGNILWKKNFGGSQIDEAFSITKTSDNHFLVVGYSRSSDINVSINNGSSDIWLIKIDENGNLIWEKNYGGSSFEEAKKIIETTNGFYIVGSSRSSDFDLQKNNGNKDGWILKIDENGNLQQQLSFGGSNLEEINSITELENGTLIVVGESWSADFDIPKNNGFSDGLLVILEK